MITDIKKCPEVYLNTLDLEITAKHTFLSFSQKGGKLNFLLMTLLFPYCFLAYVRKKSANINAELAVGLLEILEIHCFQMEHWGTII